LNLRAALFKPFWLLTWPLRTYWRHSDRKVGKRFLLEVLIKPLMPSPPSGFVATVPGGARVRLHYREDVGLATLLGGGWERAELEYASSLAKPGTAALDVGANVGVHTAVLASAVGSTGRVFAFEPEPTNLARLRANIAQNAFANVQIYPVAAAERTGQGVLHLSTDPMYHSLADIFEGRTAGADIVVETRTLDEVWRTAGSPTVSYIKIDTEGTELSVLKGGEDLLATEAPTLLVETRDPRTEVWLAERGYAARRPRGFALGNVLFEPRRGTTASRA
jgi:FkbM family methyltransferase